MTQHWFETVDFQPPSVPAIQQGLEVIEEVRGRGNSVYLHCKAGKGRSAVVAACYLIKVCVFIVSLDLYVYSLNHKATYVHAQQVH